MPDDTPDDAELIQATLNGIPSAFGDLYDRYAGLVRAMCFNATDDRTIMHDLTQEAFLRARGPARCPWFPPRSGRPGRAARSCIRP